MNADARIDMPARHVRNLPRTFASNRYQCDINVVAMPNLTVRDIPTRVYERLRRRAASNRRSMSSEIVTMLEEAVLPRPIDVDALIAEAEAVHARFTEPLPDLISEGSGRVAAT